MLGGTKVIKGVCAKLVEFRKTSAFFINYHQNFQNYILVKDLKNRVLFSSYHKMRSIIFWLRCHFGWPLSAPPRPIFISSANWQQFKKMIFMLLSTTKNEKLRSLDENWRNTSLIRTRVVTSCQHGRSKKFKKYSDLILQSFKKSVISECPACNN